MPTRVLLLAHLLSALVVSTGRAAAQRTDTAILHGTVRAAEDGTPLAGAEIWADVRGASDTMRALADSLGRFRLGRFPADTVRLRAWLPGHAAADTLVVLAFGLNEVDVRLRVQPIHLRPLTARAERMQGGPERERALFDREPVPGVIGMSGREMEVVPAFVEADVLRSLQALPGVVALNDLSAQLHVRGGGPDQNLFLLDGARIFAPYHMFGMLGAVNTDVVGRADFYRGALPARYGGALSSVVDVEQRTGAPDDSLDVDVGIGMLNAMVTAHGVLPEPLPRGTWLLSGRRTMIDRLIGFLPDHLADRFAPVNGFPYAAHDLQGRLTWEPTEEERVRASFFTSADRFRFYSGQTIHSWWSNNAGSLTFTSSRGAWSKKALVWASGYDYDLRTGDPTIGSTTRNRARLAGARFQMTRRGERAGLRLGATFEGGRVLVAGDSGAYVSGTTETVRGEGAAYAEGELWLGPVRLAPGLRLGYDSEGERVLPEPRLSARIHLGDDVALTAAAGRTVQLLSSVRDDRYALPGPPIFYVRPAGAPASVADQASAALEGWIGRLWSFEAGAYVRRLGGIPAWRPVGDRRLTGIRYDDGHAEGARVMLRRHGGILSGWVGYGYGRVRLTNAATGERYMPPWDRKHSADAMLALRLADMFGLSTRVTYGSGAPFWPFAGSLPLMRVLSPMPDHHLIHQDPVDMAPYFSDTQLRFPALFRVDVGARWSFRIAGASVDLDASVVNATGRRNIAYYTHEGHLPEGAEFDDPLALVHVLEPVPSLPFPYLPSAGIEIHF